MTPVLLARCENTSWDDKPEPPRPDGWVRSGLRERRCDGVLRYRWGQTEAACNVCAARCGIAVADWTSVEVPS